jgi:MFS family permease
MLLWSGQAISHLGSRVTFITFPLLVLALTHSPEQAGFVNAAGLLPYLLLGLPAGALIDRWNRKTVMLLADAGNTVATASIGVALWAGHLTLVHLYIVAVLGGVLFVFFNLSELSCLPQVVPKEQLPAALGQNRTTDMATLLLGTPLGTFLYQVALPVPFLVDAVSYAFSVLSLTFITTPFQQERISPPRRLSREIATGLGWVWHQPLVRILTLLTLNNLIGAGWTLVLIVLAQEHHAAPVFIGSLFSIAAAGGLVGSLLAPRLHRRFGFGPAYLGALWAEALVIPPFVVAPNALAIGLLAAALFAARCISGILHQSCLASLIPDELQGRVNSVMQVVTWGSEASGAALAGLLLQTMGATQTVWTMFGSMCFLAMLATLNRHLRHAAVLASNQVG